MKRMLLITLLSSCFMTSVLATTTITPNQNGNSGNIPSGESNLVFILTNDSWVENLSLPRNPKNYDRVVIRSEASKDSYLDGSQTDIPVESLTISSGSIYTFTYSSSLKKWGIFTDSYYPKNGISNFIVPISRPTLQRMSQAVLINGYHSALISFPNFAPNGYLINVVSSAAYQSRINTQNLSNSSSYVLKNGDNYWFRFNGKAGVWESIYSPTRVLYAKEVGPQIQSIESPVTEINFINGNWIPSIQLPATAGDRDKVILKSDAEWAAEIKNTNINTQATLKLKQGSRYEFTYFTYLSKWALTSFTQKYPVNNTRLKMQDSVLPTTGFTNEDVKIQARIILPREANEASDQEGSIAAKLRLLEGVEFTNNSDETQRHLNKPA